MRQQYFLASDWYHAITLTERIASLHPIQNRIPDFKVNVELAERRKQRWRSQFTSESCWAQRLAIDGLTENEFFYFLGEPIDAIRDRYPDPPVWLKELVQAFAHPAFSNTGMSALPEVLRGREMAGFLDAIKPLIAQGVDRVREEAQALVQMHSDLPFDPSTVEEVLFASLPGPLIAKLSRTMVLELNVARLQGMLCGTTPEERFRSFMQRMCQPDIAMALLQEYPVLARQLTLHIDRWVTCSVEFIQHLCADWDAIQTTFSPGNALGELVQLDSGMGDVHRGGRSVLIAKFSSGLKVVYKPKALAIDVHFQELLSWLNERGDHPSFRTLKILDRGTYGWVEFIAKQSCTSGSEVWQFYERQGGYLALLYALEATDFHCENLIAAGEHPVLIDLEALFHPRVGGVDIEQTDPANDSMAYSVLRVGLLPQRLFATAEHEGVDISGLGAIAGQLTPQSAPYWEGVGTDEMHLDRRRVPMPGSQNRPTLNGADVDVQDYTEAIVAGFTNIYQLLLKHRGELLANDGLLARFAEDEVRVVLRPTRTYMLLLHESFHPDLLRNGLDRDRFFDRLWVAVEHCPWLARVIAAERDDLQQGDIPMFTTHPSSRNVWSSSTEQIVDLFDEPGMVLVQRRLQQLSDNDLLQQLWFIRASLATLSMGKDRAKWPTYQLAKPQVISDQEQLLAGARAVGDRLEALALRGEDDVSWIGLTLVNSRHWTLMPLGMDLYSGTSGVALFLAYLGAITHEKRYTALAQAALKRMQRQVERAQSSIKEIGCFDGWGGVIYTLTHLGMLWDESALLAEAEALVEILPPLIEQDEQLDLVGGVAGCIGSLISLYQCVPSDRTLAAAIQCGDQLIAHAQPMEQGIGWVTRMTRTKPMTGFSHGSAGMAWALLELAALIGEERFRTVALAAIDYERSLFSPKAGNWSDLRELDLPSGSANDSHDSFMTTWCHGAPGIGLARLRALQHFDDGTIRQEIDTAIRTTLAQGFGLNHSLCHGDLGNLELLVHASQVLDDSQLHIQVERITATLLESISKNGWLCGVPLGVETPGLMNGLSGIGYGLLRLAEPRRVPSVLVLEPPTLHTFLPQCQL